MTSKVKKIVKLNDRDVVNTNDPEFIGLHKIFLISDLLNHIKAVFQEKTRFYCYVCNDSGHPCQVLQENGGGWQKGHIRISFEFITEVEEIALLKESENIEKGDSSVLDEIRQLNP